MDVLKNLIGLTLILVCAIASRSEYDCKSILNQNHSICACVSIGYSYEIDCPNFETSVIVKFESSTNNVDIKCMNFRETVYEQLAGIEIGDVKDVRFLKCPLPTTGSLIAILKKIGITRPKSLEIKSYIVYPGISNSLERQHLNGFTDLERLTVKKYKLSMLSDDVFTDVGNITKLILDSIEAKITVNIFRRLGKLEHLELRGNILRILEPGVFRYQRKLNKLILSGNSLQNLSKESFEGALSLSELNMTSNGIETLQADTFSFLTNLTKIDLSKNNILELPAGLFQNNKKLIQLILTENRVSLDTLPNSFLSNLVDMEDVNITCGLNIVPGDLFTGSLKIKTISLTKNKLVSLPVKLFTDQSNLQDLDLSGNLILDLDDELFDSMRQLLVLKLSSNRLTTISERLFNGLIRVKEIYLDNNQLGTIHELAFKTTMKLRNLQLQNNHLSHFCLRILRDLETLNLRNNNVTAMPELMEINHSLKDLDLSCNSLSSLSIMDLQDYSKDISINLSNNSIWKLSYYEIIPDPNVTVTVMLSHNPLTCDCQLYNFIKYINSSKPMPIVIQADNLTCASPASLSGKLVTQLQPKDFVCAVNNPKRCPTQCICLRRIVDRTMEVNCANTNIKTVPPLPEVKGSEFEFIELHLENNSLTELPNLSQLGYSNVSVISAKNNNIVVIDRNNILPKLRKLDVSHNRIMWLNDTGLIQLNKTSELKNITMGQNPWNCDCELETFVKLNYEKILDKDNVKCQNGRPLIQVDICSEHQSTNFVLSVLLSLLGMLTAILAALYYKYDEEIKVWMYANVQCPLSVPENEDDGREYDAFISYSHIDADFVAEKLLPRLENGSPSFRLCLHERDWVVGEFIAESIIRSVENSRRTIIILTSNFLKSDWGKMEFQVAHKHAITDGRVRLIVVIYGNIGDIENLDPIVKVYLKTNTYLQWGDPWFWKKLLYAMPHK